VAEIYNWQSDKISRDPEKYLLQDGVFFVRTWTMKSRHQTIVHKIENTFDVVEKETHPESHLVVIVSRQPTSRGEPAKTGDRS
jgi:hypothetical protein